MKTVYIIAFLCAGSIFAPGCGERAGDSDSRKPTVPEFKTEQLVKDLETKWVIMAPQGHLWGFSPDQKIALTVLETKFGAEQGYLAKDKAVVAVQLTATASIPTPTDIKEQSNKKLDVAKAPVSVELSGIAKMHYERIADQWFLTEVEGVALVVKPR